jgi:hypothetical protein
MSLCGMLIQRSSFYTQNMDPLKTPVLFLIFNRPETTDRVFAAIRNARPQKLYIAADGPRAGVNEDILLCKQTRSIRNQIDWECEVKTLFRDENLGSKFSMISALDWFFENEEEGIILEDDCLPGNEFFRFCSTLLDHYRNDHRIMHIGGTNLQFGQKRGEASYYFSAIASIWGWASWKRVWKLCDHSMKKFPEFEEEDLMVNIFQDRKTADWITAMARHVYENKVIAWDYPMAFSIAINNGLCITPNTNLVSNIGFGENASHTKDASHVHANIPIGKPDEPLTHPLFLIPDRKADIYQLSLTINDVKQSQLKKSKNEAGTGVFRKLIKKYLIEPLVKSF